MGSRAFTVRIPEEQAEELEAIAAVEGVPVAEQVRAALAERIAEKRKDPEFQAWAKDFVKKNRRILDRLAE